MKKKNQMSLHRLENFTKGWIVGQFSPTLLPTNDFEMAVKIYQKGEHEAKHFHKIGKEFTVIVSGVFQMNETVLHAGDIVVLEPNTAANFLCLKKGSTAVIKGPSIPGDKY